MRDQHVVQHHDVAILPTERDGLVGQHSAHLVKDLVGDGPAIGVVDVARQVLHAQDVFERLAHLGLQTRCMKEMRLVEPHGFARQRMMFHALAQLARAQGAVVQPFPFDAALAAERLYPRRLVGVEHVLPGQIKIAVVAHVQQACREALADGGGHAAIDVAAVGDRGLAALWRGLDAMEPDLHRPVACVGLFVMQGDVLMRRILGAGVYARGHGATRRRRKFIAQQVVSERRGEAFERIH
ncbi:hypothetical protein D3C72_1400440 [compost metagenome]